MPCHASCGSLVHPPGIELKPLAVNAWNPNHWTTREFPSEIYFLKTTYFQFLSYLLIILKISNFQSPSSSLWCDKLLKYV